MKDEDVKLKNEDSEWTKFAENAGLSEFKTIEEFGESYKKLAKEKGELEKSKQANEQSFSDILKAARKDVAESQNSNNKKAVQDYLSDPIVKNNVERAANAEGTVEELQKRINNGDVNLNEIRLWSKLGEEPAEGSGDVGTGNGKRQSAAEKESELLHITRKLKHIWTDERHPQYKETVERMQTLEKELIG